MYRLLYILIIVISIAGTTSCCKRRVYCQSTPMNIAFVGFTRSEARTVVLKRYSKTDSLYKKAIDSSQLIYGGDAPVVPNKKDTLWLSDYTSNGNLSSIYHGNNWKLIISAVKYEYIFSNIFDEEHRADVVGCNDKEADCSNHITTYSLNGTWYWGEKLFLGK